MGAAPHPPASPPAVPVPSVCTCRRWGGSVRAGWCVPPPHPPPPLQHSPHPYGEAEDDGQQQTAPRHQEGVGGRGGADGGLQYSSCSMGGGVGVGDGVGGGPSPPRSPQLHPHPRHHQQCHHQRARAAAWPHSRRDHPQQGTAGTAEGAQWGFLGGGEGCYGAAPHRDTVTPPPTCEL